MSTERSTLAGKVSSTDIGRDGFGILPLRPFARARFERHAEWRDVLSG